jgi:hypothetical protein
MGTLRRTVDLQFGNLTTIQISKTGANQFSDTQALDDIAGGGTGPFLVLERGIFKYPQQAVGGRIAIPSNTGRPVRLACIAANLGAPGATLAIHVAGFDGTGGRPDNLSGEPYEDSDAPLYREGDVLVDSLAGQYISKNYDPQVVDTSILLHPGQHLYCISTGASAGLLRATFSLSWDIS